MVKHSRGQRKLVRWRRGKSERRADAGNASSFGDYRRLTGFVHRNPGLIDTLDSIARRIGRTGNAIEEDVRGLVNLGILKTRRIGRSEVLLLDRARDREVLDAIAKHLRNLEGVEKIDNAKF